MKKTLTVTKEHLDRALAVPWDTCSCIIAQCITDEFGKPFACGQSSAHTDNFQVSWRSEYTFNVMGKFDAMHARGSKTITKEDIEKLLPITFEVEVKEV